MGGIFNFGDGGGGGGGSVTVIRDATALGIDPYATFYVDPTGSNTNNGIDAPFQTFDYAYGYVASLRWELGITAFPTISLNDGAYETEASSNYDGFIVPLGCDGIQIQSTSGSANDVTLNTNRYLIVYGDNNLVFQNIELVSVSTLQAISGGRMGIYNCIITGNSADQVLVRGDYGGQILVQNSTLEYDDPAQTYFCQATRNGIVAVTGTLGITVSNGADPDYASAFAVASDRGYCTFQAAAITVTSNNNNATGKRYQLTSFGGIYTVNAGANFLPGTVAGTADGSSLYY